MLIVNCLLNSVYLCKLHLSFVLLEAKIASDRLFPLFRCLIWSKKQRVSEGLKRVLFASPIFCGIGEIM